MHVFISYRRADTAFAAHAVAYAVRAAGGDAFVDTGSIAGGQDFARAIADTISHANLVLALVGPHFDAESLSDPRSVVAWEWRRSRFHGLPVLPVLVDGATLPAAGLLPGDLRWFPRPNAFALRRQSLSADIDALVGAVLAHPGGRRPVARVLWVDDRPANNETERELLRRHGILFDNVVSTTEAIDQLQYESYDLVITDLGRQGSSDRSSRAGEDLLTHPALGETPVVVYAGPRAVAREAELVERGATAVMAGRKHLIESVLGLLGRAALDGVPDLDQR